MQTLHEFTAGVWHEIHIPSAGVPLRHFPELKWGAAGQLFSPAFWRHQHWTEVELKPHNRKRYRIGESLLEEVVACVLGGHGLPAECSLAYYEVIRGLGLFSHPPSNVSEVHRIMKNPVEVEGRPRRYRFWRSKGDCVFSMLTRHRPQIRLLEESVNDAKELRQRLCELPGIGMKTASWIARNWLDSDAVAVIDIHILRCLANLGADVPVRITPDGYLRAEQSFLKFAESIGVEPQTLDLVIWSRMRQLVPVVGAPERHSVLTALPTAC